MKATTYLRLAITVVLLLSCSVITHAQPAEILMQDFAAGTPINYVDFSLKTIWGTNTTPTSAFSIGPKSDANGVTYPAITATDSAMKYAAFQLPNGLKTSQVLDFPLGVLDRGQGDSIIVEFDAIWQLLSAGGERGRIVAALLHQAPDYNNIPMGLVDSVNQVAPFGRPAYNWRGTNRFSQGTNNYAHLFYGGGKDREGECEKFSNPTIGSWWLPGFISMPTGLTPGARPLYPAGPGNSWGPNTLASSTSWTRYKISLTREQVNVTFKPLNTGREELCNSLFIPIIDQDTLLTIQRLNAHYGTTINKMPPLYQHWDTIRALRIFMNSGERAFISNIKVSFSGSPVSASKLSKPNATLSIWPNPANAINDYVFIKRGDVGLSGCQLTLTDALGRKVWAGVETTETTGRLSTAGLKAGLYNLQCIDRQGQVSMQRLCIGQ